MKRAHSGAGGLNYYKASHHNYVIFTPTKEELMHAGLSGKGIYTFHAARTQANPTKDEEKARLKRWVLKRCQESGIPVDETLSNNGFVNAPNDVMAFDFSEIWKCKKNFAVNFPPLDYDVEKDGIWTGLDLIPPIGLVGDSVTESFWIAGVGLQRGWNGIMDACYLVDNLYNMTFSGGPDPIEPESWEDHMNRIQGLLPKLHECAHDGLMTRDGLAGQYAEQSVVIAQITKKSSKDAERPKWQLEIEPHMRYESFAKLSEAKYKGAKSLENTHPVVRRALALMNAASAFCAKKLLSVNGKTVPTAKAPLPIRRAAEAADSSPMSPRPIPQEEVVKVANSKSDNLHSMLAQQMERYVQKATAAVASVSTPFNDERWKELSPQEEASGFVQRAEREWDVMTEQHLSPAQKAELQHIRNMKSSLQQQITSMQQQITLLQSSYEAFEHAETEMLVKSNP